MQDAKEGRKKWYAANLIDFEYQLVRLWEKGKIRVPVHFCGGNEEQLIRIFQEVKHDDYVFSTHRNHYHALLHGVEAKRIIGKISESRQGQDGDTQATGCESAALGGSMCILDHSRHFYSSAIVAGNCAPACGVAWALKATRGNQRHVWCFVGDGALDNGHFWEAYRYSIGWDLPITFVVENNDRSTCTSVGERFGPSDNTFNDIPQGEIVKQGKIWMYSYEPTYPHVGSGKYVQF